MALSHAHELHKRRLGRNAGVGLTLFAFIALVFGLTIAKISGGSEMQGYDHTYQVEMDPATQAAAPTAEAGH